MAELRRLRERLDRFTGLHNALAASVSEQLAPELAVLRSDTAEALAVHTAQLERILKRQGRQSNPPVDWAGMTAEQAEQQWPILAQWVAVVLAGWYELTRDELPDCWALHRPVLVELSWLRSAYVQAYLADADPHVAADWHTRWRAAVLDRVQKLIPGHLCRPGEHLVTEEESRARRTPHPVNAPPPPLTGLQLAEPQYWGQFYQQAVRADLARRRATEVDPPPGSGNP